MQDAPEPLIQVFLVDDSPQFLQAAARFLSTDAQVEIVGQAFSGRACLRQLSQLDPDLVLIDMAMPDMSGVEVTRHIKAEPDAPRVVMLSLYDNLEYRARATAAGADGYVAKSEMGEQLLPLIHSLCGPAKGGNVISGEHPAW